MASGDPVARLLIRASEPVRAMIVIAGAVLIHLSLGTYHTFGNMVPYMASYMHNFTDSHVTIERMMWIPMLQGAFPMAMVFGGCLYHRYGARLAALIGCALMSSGVALSAYTIRRSFSAFLFTYGLMFGLGQGIAYVVAVACAINWAPHNVGLVSGVVVAGFGISSSIFAPIQTHLVNPLNYVPTKAGYFPQADLLARVPDVFAKLSIVYAVMQAIGLIVMCDPPNFFNDCPQAFGLFNLCCPETFINRRRVRSRRPWSRSTVAYRRVPVDEEDANCPSKSEDSVGLLVDEEDSGDEAAPTRANISNNNTANPVSLNTNEMLRSSTFYWLFAALFCCSFYVNLFYNLYKTFAETFIDDDMFLAFAFSVGSIANSIARVGWGILADRTSFQVSLVLSSCVATILLLTMPMTPSGGKYMFLIWLTLMFICMASTHALFISATVRCFGPRHKATNYGVLILSTTLSGILLAAIIVYWLQALGYRWVFLFAAAFPFAAFLITSAIHTTVHGKRIS